jgi:magnesium-transporting ATPase (P-type)
MSDSVLNGQTMTELDSAPVWHAMAVDEVLAAQGVDPGTGLHESEVLRRREQFGPNRFAEAASEPPWRVFLRQYQDLMQIVLLVAARTVPAPADHLEQPPRDPERPVVPRDLMVWLAAVGLVMGTATLAVLSWAFGEHGEPVARTMGLTTFLVAVVLLSLESRDQRRSIFNLEVLDDRTFLIATGISAAVIYLSTTFSGFQRILDTTALSLNQWIICILAGAGVIVASEIRKVFLRRRLPDPDNAVV